MEECNYYLSLSKESMDEYNKKYPGAFSIDECKYIIDSNNKPASFFLVFDRTLTSGIIRFIIPFFVPLILLYPVIYRLSLEFEDDFIKSFLQRKSYKSYILHLFKVSYKYRFLILVILMFIIFGSMIISKFNFNPLLDIYLKYIGDVSMLFYSNSFNYIIYFVIIILNLLLYINIALIVLRYNNKNFLISYAESFLVIYLWWCFTFIIVGKFLKKYMNILSEHVNILEIYTWHGITNPYPFLIINIIYYLVSLFLVLLVYKNKEKFIIKCEE